MHTCMHTNTRKQERKEVFWISRMGVAPGKSLGISWVEKSLFCYPHRIRSGKNQQWILHLGQFLMRSRIFFSWSPRFSPLIPYELQGREKNVIIHKDNCSSDWNKFHQWGTDGYHVSTAMKPCGHTTCAIILLRMKTANLIAGKNQINTKWRCIYYIPKKRELRSSKQNVNVMKDKESLWKYSRLKKSKEMWQLNTIPDPTLDSVLEGKKTTKQTKNSYKRYYWIIWQNWNTKIWMSP